MRFLLDEDLPPLAAETARGLGLDVTSVHELGRIGLSDPDQLRFAVTEDRVMVTRNRDDFIRLTAEFFRTGEPHPGLLVVSRAIPSSKPERIAHVLLGWSEAREDHPQSFGKYSIDFLGTSRGE